MADAPCPCTLNKPVASAGTPPVASNASQSVQRTIYPVQMYWRRPSATFAHTGVQYDAGTALGIIAPASDPQTGAPMRLNGLSLYSVQTADGLRGYAALSDADLRSTTRPASRAALSLPLRGPVQSGFWLRDSQTPTFSHNAPSGVPFPHFPRGTVVTVSEALPNINGSLRLYRVSVPDGRTGIAAFSRADLAGMRSYAATILRSYGAQPDDGLGDLASADSLANLGV